MERIIRLTMMISKLRMMERMKFKHLQKGKYRLFAYSKDSTGAKTGFISGLKIPVFIDVEITSNGTVVNAPDLIILDNNQ